MMILTQHLRQKQNKVATALTVYGIETVSYSEVANSAHSVATALTVYGIETVKVSVKSCT